MGSSWNKIVRSRMEESWDNYGKPFPFFWFMELDHRIPQKNKGTTFIMTPGGQWDDMTENGVDGQRK